MLGVISASSVERTSVSTYRFVLAFFGGLAVQKFTEPLVDFFGRRFGESKTALINGAEILVVDRQTGFFWTAVCYSVVAAILFLCTFWTTRERVQPVEAENHRFSSDVSDLLKNRPWLVLLAVGLFQILSDWTRGSAIAYYFTYFVKSEFGNFLVAGTVASIVGMLMTKPLTAIFGKDRLNRAPRNGARLFRCHVRTEARRRPGRGRAGVGIGRISVSTSSRRRAAGAERRDHPGHHRDDEFRPRPLSARGDRRHVLLQRHERGDPADRSRPGCAQVPRDRASGCLRCDASSEAAHALDRAWRAELVPPSNKLIL